MLIYGFEIDCVPTAIVGYVRRSDAQIRIKPVGRCPRRGERRIQCGTPLPVVNGLKDFLTRTAALRNLGHDFFNKVGQRSTRKPQRFLGALFNRAIYANIHLRHAANGSHLNLTFSIC